MATRAIGAKPPQRTGIAADTYEKVLAVAAAIIFVAASTAIVRGAADWARMPAMLWFHLATVLLATGLTPVILLRRRGDRPHRLLGTIWVAAMIATAAGSLFLTMVRPGHYSLIHILSVWTLIQVPLLWWTARTHQVARHRGCVRGMVTGALVIAGFFTFPFDRLLGHWLFA